MKFGLSPLRGWILAFVAAAGLVLAPALIAGSADAQQQKRERTQSPRKAPPRDAKRTPAPSTQPGGAPETTARQAIIVDFQTGAMLYEKNADERMPPSSMSKAMTMYMVFKALKEGRLKLDDTLPVSERAWRMQGSKMFVPLGGRVGVEDLIRGVIVQSGNDACVVLAEGLAGSEEAFAERMNVEAKRLGLTASNFRNSDGWPHPDHYMTARDLALLSKHLIADFPEHYHYFKEMEFVYGKDQASGKDIRQGNRNPLLYKNTGADGIKTGHAEEAGYGLTASAVREGRRVIMVFNGWPSLKVRAEESERMLEWSYREFANYTLFKAGDPVDRAEVWLGEKPNVALVATKDIVVTLPRKVRPQMKASVVYDGPVPAPVVQGSRIGKLVVTAPGVETVEVPLVAQADVPRLGFAGRIAATVGHLIFGGGAKK
jgi:D-alanyl-D-alanine carboxypeptidase (penicillin-binding protein 5/6)